MTQKNPINTNDLSEAAKKSSDKSDTIHIENPKLLSALEKLCDIKREINQDCYVGNDDNPTKVMKCHCKKDNLNKLYEAEKEYYQVLKELLDENPSLKDKAVMLEGAFGFWQLSLPKEPSLKAIKELFLCD